MRNAALPRRHALAVLAAGLASCSRQLSAVAGSQDGAERMLLAEIAARMLEKNAQAKVERRLGLGDSSALFQAIQNGDVQVYPEYARMGYKVYFKQEEPIDEAMSTEKLRGLFRTNALSEWLGPLGFESNHMVLGLRSNPLLQGVATMGELVAKGERWTLGFTSEFSQSIEGYAAMKNAYPVAEKGAPRIEPLGQLYFGLNERRMDLLVTTTTDPLAYEDRYLLLGDDRRAFAGNRASYLVRGRTPEEEGKLLEALRPLLGKLDEAKMRALNGAVLRDKRSVEEVAAEFVASLA
jgi:osmoprotectant transport system permease protein